MSAFSKGGGTRVAALCAVAAALAIWAAPASAARLSPVSQDFGPQQIGTSGAPVAFTLTAGCNFELLGTCPIPEMLSTSIGLGTTDFSQANDCPPVLVGSVAGVSCTINVTFYPKALGGRSDMLRTGGPSATLTGEGVLPPQRKCRKKKGKGKKGKGAAAAKRKCGKKKGKPRPVIEPF